MLESVKIDLTGKLALVTGGASGIGQAIAEELAKKGSKVIICDVDIDRGQSVAKSVGGEFRTLDVRDRKLCWETISEIESKTPIEVLVCCAGVVRPCSVFGFPGVTNTPEANYGAILDEYQRENDINVLGYLNVILAVVPKMRERGKGSICVIGSGAGDVGLYERFPYCITKGAVHQLVRAAACDFTKSGATGLRIFGIAPARVLSPLMENNLNKIEAGKGKAARDLEFKAYGDSQFEGRVLSTKEVADLALFQIQANNTSGEILAVGGWKGQPW